LTDAETVERLIAEKEAETARHYVCLDCGTTVEGFPVECPDCESSSFETAPGADTDENDRPADHVLAAYAELSAPYNPYVPR
jgi:predicted ATP-dependent serine protease